MIAAPFAPVVVDGRVGRRASNALFIDFSAAGAAVATAQQGAAEGLGGKAAMLFGFKNGGSGRHLLTYPNGATLVVESREQEPTLVSRGDGAAVAVIERGPDCSVAREANGAPVLQVSPHPEGGITPDLFRALVTAPDASTLGHLHVIRTSGGWDIRLVDVLDVLTGGHLEHTASSLPIPLLGTRLTLVAPTTPVQREVLLAVCVDVALGLRPYFRAMG